jgi:hypothetical protein
MKKTHEEKETMFFMVKTSSISFIVVNREANSFAPLYTMALGVE